MSGYLVLLSVAVLICKVHSQLCSPPILPAPCSPPCVPIPCQPTTPPCPTTCPQVINPNPYVTTIIDNSVSNALVNALQLLIVSNLIGSTVGPSAPVNNLGPLLESLVCSNPCALDLIIPEYGIPPYGPLPSCGSYVDLIPPLSPIVNCGPYYEYIPPYGPTTYPSYELVPPCGTVIDPYLPLCGLSDVYPSYITYTETLPFYIDSYPYGYGETVFPFPGIDTISPNFCGLPEIISNCINYPIPEIGPINPYYGGYETLTPAVAPNVFGCLNEVVPTYGPLVVPNYCGLPEPAPAEVIFPSPIPGPLGCSYGYAPSSLPCVRVNVDPLVNDNCVYGYGGPIYY